MSDIEDLIKLLRIQPNDFTIRIRPQLTEGGKWEGDVDVSLMSHPGNDINDEDYEYIMHYCKMIASSVPIMEENQSIREIANEYVLNHIDTEYDVDVEEDNDNEEKPTVTQDGNIHTINFNSNTKGSA